MQAFEDQVQELQSGLLKQKSKAEAAEAAQAALHKVLCSCWYFVSADPFAHLLCSPSNWTISYAAVTVAAYFVCECNVASCSTT